MNAQDSITKQAITLYHQAENMPNQWNDDLILCLTDGERLRHRMIFENDLIFRQENMAAGKRETKKAYTVEPKKNDQILLEVDVNKLKSILSSREINIRTSEDLMEFLQSGDCNVWSVFKISSEAVVKR